MIETQKQYAYQLDRWCKNEGDDEEYIQVFYQRLENSMNVCMSYDDRIVCAVNKLLKKFEYVAFSNQPEHESPLRKKLKKVVEALREYEFISMQHCHDLIAKIEGNFLREKIEYFIQSADQAQENYKRALEQFQISRIWKQTIQRNFEQTWSFLVSRKIYDQIILALYEASLPLIKKYSIQKIQQINEYYQQINKHLYERNRNSLILDDLFRPCNNFIKNQQFSVTMNKFITEKSLFLNKEMLELAYQQIKIIVAIIKSNVSFSSTLTFELYGSMKTGFAIINESDGDINLIPQGKFTFVKRNEKIQCLNEVYNAIRGNSQVKLEYSSIQVYIKQRIRIPFIKLKFHNHSKDNKDYVLRSVDLVVNSQNGIQNSKILELYSKSQYIIKFGNLIKYWAKRKTLINTSMPTQGLSSYGVILMTIFYLIKTNQAPYVIKMNEEYRLQKNLLGQKDCLPLFDNFRGFLEFYKLNGRFFVEKMIVCLMERFELNYNSNKFLVNMHDFIDGSNPGRMGKCYATKFFNILNATYIQLINYEDFSRIMKYES